ncbi:MAG: potassium-transporting ATPase subunit KdpC [Chloroflexi bacterium]|nr:MAG: potassium-transporting ATPase subunit KdpC [Chloroflexota bacterium]
MFRLIRPALVIFGLLTLLTGLLYPAVITGLAQLIFPYQANGSLITRNGQVVGSALIGQPFNEPKYFWGRPSATGGQPYNAAASSGSNLGPTNPALGEQVSERIAALKAADPGNNQPIPVDLVTASASGLDPDISIAAAQYQAARVARERGISLEQVQTLIDQNTTGRQFGILGEPRVNVLRLNLALDELK